VNKIGYPDKWRDYSSVDIKPATLSANVQRATTFESKRDLAKIGKPLDRGEWGMSPPTVNAYFNGQMNDINFPPACCNLRCTTRRWTMRPTTATPGHHRPRTHPRLRRRRPPVRRSRQPERLVDQGRREKFHRSGPVRSRSIRAVCHRRRHQDQLQADRRRRLATSVA